MTVLSVTPQYVRHILDFHWLCTVCVLSMRLAYEWFVLRMTILLTIAGWCLFSTSFVLYVMFCRSLFVHFSVGHSVVCPSATYGFRLPFWYLQATFILILPLFLICCLYPVRPLPLLSYEPCQWSKELACLPGVW